MTDITYPTLHATHFDYDADGRKTHMSDATGDTYWSYAADGIHLVSQTTPQGIVYHTYDGDGRPYQRSINTPSTGQTAPWTNTYDAAGRLIKLGSPTDGATTFAYDAADRPTSKTEGNGNYELYAYDAADQLTSIGYWWADGTEQNAQTYSYTPGGSVQTMNQGYYATTYGYDGANQLVGETNSGSYPPPSLGFTYDHNGNRLTQTSSGTQVQSFTYNGHDVMTHGTAGNETPGWDYNGNEISNNVSGAQFSYDDEDRLVSATGPGYADTFTYNGLGLRVGKTDSTGTYSYLCDGTSPGSPVLNDGHALYTPGLSENKGGASRFYSFDRIGNLWTIDGSSKGQLFYEDNAAYGGLFALSGSGTAFGFGGANGCQTDADTGLVLMGHRYYDTRIGRFISQDHAKSGGNWYAYAGNNPPNKTDPSGLTPMDGPGASLLGSPGAMANGNGGNGFGNDDSESYENNQQVDQNIADHAKATMAHFKPLAPGHVANFSRYAIPILFDGKAVNGESDPHYILMLPPDYESTFFTDIDYVYYGNDPSSNGGFDWRHIPAFTWANVDSAGPNQISIDMSNRNSVTYGLPYGWNPYPLSPQQAINDGYIERIPTGSGSGGSIIGIGPIIM